jgi:hypothetical protein
VARPRLTLAIFSRIGAKTSRASVARQGSGVAVVVAVAVGDDVAVGLGVAAGVRVLSRGFVG